MSNWKPSTQGRVSLKKVEASFLTCSFPFSNPYRIHGALSWGSSYTVWFHRSSLVPKLDHEFSSLPIHSCFHVTALQPCSSRSPLQITFFFWWVPWGSSQHSPQAVLERVGGYWAGAPRQEWPVVGAQMDFLQQASSPKEMHHGTRAVLSLFTVLPVLSDFFSSCYIQHIPGSTVTDALAAAFTLSFQKNSPLMFWQRTGIIYSARSLQWPSLASSYFTASYCSAHFLSEWGLCLWQVLVLYQDLKFPVSQSLLWVSLCLKHSGLDFQRGWNEEQKQCLFSPCES